VYTLITVAAAAEAAVAAMVAISL